MTSTEGEPTASGRSTRLGDRVVARIGFGAMQLAEGAATANTDDPIVVLQRAVSLGVDHIDTAQFYGAGVSNTLIRRALHPYPEGLALVSKVGATRDTTGSLIPAQRPEQLRDQVEENLRTLGVSSLAVINLRRLDARPGLVATGEQLVDLEDQLSVLIELRREGKIGGIGLSNVDAEQVRQARPAGIDCVQNSHSPLDRCSDPVLDECRLRNVAWVPFFPLGSAFPNNPKVSGQPVIQSIAARLGATPSQVGLAWHLHHYAHTLLIPGTSRISHLEDNMASGNVRLDDGMVAAIDALSPGR